MRPVPGVALVTSQYIVDEFFREAGQKLKAPPEKIARAVRYLRQHAQWVTPAATPPDACRDPDDLAVLGTAVAAKADCLVTGDSDLLSLGSYVGVAILSPRDAYQRLR